MPERGEDRGYLRHQGIRLASAARCPGEVIVADNGSTDGSRTIAARLGARVVPVATKGYGNAVRAGIEAARGKFVIMGDSDDSYDFSALEGFVGQLRDGYDLVLGNRFEGGIAPGAMPALHKFFGNPLLTRIGRTLYGSPSRDFNCGLRGFRRDAIVSLDLDAAGMEFAVEMIVKATIRNLRITEVPIRLSVDGRDRPPHLRSWRDGWRTLRFFLLFSPRELVSLSGRSDFPARTSGDLDPVYRKCRRWRCRFCRAHHGYDGRRDQHRLRGDAVLGVRKGHRDSAWVAPSRCAF